jgi:hypothetical protein
MAVLDSCDASKHEVHVATPTWCCAVLQASARAVYSDSKEGRHVRRSCVPQLASFVAVTTVAAATLSVHAA